MAAASPQATPLDGVLETYHWYGKAFRGPDDVVPLRVTLLPDPRWLERWPWWAHPPPGTCSSG